MREVWRDAELLVIEKPSGLASQPAPGVDDVYTLLKRQFPYVGLHHRLDQPASGLMLVTLAEAANERIARAFREHTIRRTYRAVLQGEVVPGTWDRPIEGQPAKTDVRLLGRGAGMSAVELELHTGRTHQIRIHAALAGRPVMGDRKYGEGRRWPRLALHAWRLAFVATDGSDVVVESPIPDDLTALWTAAGGP